MRRMLPPDALATLVFAGPPVAVTVAVKAAYNAKPKKTIRVGFTGLCLAVSIVGKQIFGP